VQRDDESSDDVEQAYRAGLRDFTRRTSDPLADLRNPYDPLRQAPSFDAWERAIFDAAANRR